jgi:hypothetical protein
MKAWSISRVGFLIVRRYVAFAPFGATTAMMKELGPVIGRDREPERSWVPERSVPSIAILAFWSSVIIRTGMEARNE